MLRPGHAVAVCVLALLTIGIVMVNSAGMTIQSRETFTIESILLSRTSIYAGLAMLAMIACAFVPVRRLVPSAPGGMDNTALEEPALSPSWFRAVMREYISLWPVWACIFAMLVLLASVYMPGIRSPKNGSHRWINLHVPGFESVQPSEVAKWGMVLVVAWFASRSAAKMRSFWVGLVPGLAAIGVVAGFVVLEDLGTGALMGAAACIVLIAAGVRLWQLLLLCPLPLAGAVLAIVTNPYRMHRIESFMNPYLDPQGKGFHMIQSMLAVSGGNIFGRGLGGGLQKYDYLPEDTTDFIFAIICEELGVFGAAIVLFLIGCLVWSVWQVVRREEVRILKLIGLGVMATVGVQAAINLAVVTGLGPTKGIALPLISSGGTGWILTAAALGLVIAMDRAQHAASMHKSGRADATPDEPDVYAMPALGAVAVGAVAAAATLAEMKPEPAPQRVVVAAEEVEEEPVAAEEDADALAAADHDGNADVQGSAPLDDEAKEVIVAAAEPAASPAIESTGLPPAPEGMLFDLKPAFPLVDEPEPHEDLVTSDGETDDAEDAGNNVDQPEIVVTDAARTWLQRGEEPAQA